MDLTEWVRDSCARVATGLRLHMLEALVHRLLFHHGSVQVPPSRFLAFINGLDECQGRDDQHHIPGQISYMVNTQGVALENVLAGQGHMSVSLLTRLELKLLIFRSGDFHV